MIDLTETARLLNRKRITAAPCPWVPALSVAVDEEYENYDFDVIGPRTRLRLVKVLEGAGYRHLSGNVLEGPLGRLEFPRPARSLSEDPAAGLEQVAGLGRSVAIATPTQVLLATLRSGTGELSEARRTDLIGLVREQPANLEKIAGRLARTSFAPVFARLARELAGAQREGVEQRRRGVFKSRLPH